MRGRVVVVAACARTCGVFFGAGTRAFGRAKVLAVFAAEAAARTVCARRVPRKAANVAGRLAAMGFGRAAVVTARARTATGCGRRTVPGRRVLIIFRVPVYTLAAADEFIY